MYLEMKIDIQSLGQIRHRIWKCEIKEVAERSGGRCGRAEKGVKCEMSCRLGLRMVTESAGSFLAHLQCSAKICDIMHRSAEGSNLYNPMNKAGRSVS